MLKAKDQSGSALFRERALPCDTLRDCGKRDLQENTEGLQACGIGRIPLVVMLRGVRVEFTRGDFTWNVSLCGSVCLLQWAA
jgi:hypothetical protein